MEEHAIHNLASMSPNDKKKMDLANHLASGYHNVAHSYTQATLHWLEKKHKELHG